MRELKCGVQDGNHGSGPPCLSPPPTFYAKHICSLRTWGVLAAGVQSSSLLLTPQQTVRQAGRSTASREQRPAGACYAAGAAAVAQVARRGTRHARRCCSASRGRWHPSCQRLQCSLPQGQPGCAWRRPLRHRLLGYRRPRARSTAGYQPAGRAVAGLPAPPHRRSRRPQAPRRRSRAGTPADTSDDTSHPCPSLFPPAQACCRARW